MTDTIFDSKSRAGTTEAALSALTAVAPQDGLRTAAEAEPVACQRPSDSPLMIAGELSIRTATAVRQTLTERVGQGPNLVLDLSGVTECDTAGLQLLYSIRRAAAERMERFQIVAVSPEVEKIAATLGLQISDLSNVYDTAAVDAGSGSRSTDGGI